MEGQREKRLRDIEDKIQRPKLHLNTVIQRKKQGKTNLQRRNGPFF